MLPPIDLSSDDGFEQLKSQAEEFVKTIGRFRVEIIGQELFGDNNDIPVYLVGDNMRALHMPILDIALGLGYGQSFDQRHTGNSYRPHITKTPEISLEKDGSIDIDSVTIFQRQADGKISIDRHVHLGV